MVLTPEGVRARVSFGVRVASILQNLNQHQLPVCCIFNMSNVSHHGIINMVLGGSLLTENLFFPLDNFEKTEFLSKLIQSLYYRMTIIVCMPTLLCIHVQGTYGASQPFLGF